MADSNEEKWRELHGISETSRVWISSKGRVKTQPQIFEDPVTFRKIIYIDGCPVFIDSMVMSSFGGRGYDRHPQAGVVYKDSDPTNLDISNLSWEIVKDEYRGPGGKQSARRREYITSMTVTPEMVRNETYPITHKPEPDPSTYTPPTPSDATETPIRNESPSLIPTGLTDTIDQMKSMVQSINGRMNEILSDKFMDTVVERTAAIIDEKAENSIISSSNIQNPPGHPPDIVRRLNVPPGHIIVRQMTPEGYYRYMLVREKIYKIAKDVIEAFREGDDWKSRLPDPNTPVVINPGYNPDDFFRDVEDVVADKIKTEEIKEEDVAVADAVVAIERHGKKRERSDVKHEEIEKQKARDMNLKVTASEIIEEIKKIDRTSLEKMGYRVGDRVMGHSKPVIITDMRNMREMYVPSSKAAAELLDVPYHAVIACVYGRRKQIGPYQLRYKYWGDASHVLSGIYKDYMELIQKRADDIKDMEEEEFEELSRQLEEMEKEEPEENNEQDK